MHKYYDPSQVHKAAILTLSTNKKPSVLFGVIQVYENEFVRYHATTLSGIIVAKTTFVQLWKKATREVFN